MRRLLARFVLVAFHVGFVRPLHRWFVGARYRRAGLVPQGPCVVVSNHNSHLDTAVLMGLFPLKRLPHVHPVAAADYFGSSWARRTLAMLLMNGIPIERRPRSGVDPLQPLVDAVAAGESLIFFPEGSRGEAGVISPFRPGIGHLVQRLPGLLVVPVFLSGPERVWPRGQPVPLPGLVDVYVGRPRTYPSEWEAKRIAEEVQRDVLQLAPPEPPRPEAALRPVRVAVCGIDAPSRDVVFRLICERLGREDRCLGISDPLLEADAGGLREVPAPIPQPRFRASWLTTLARIFRTGGSFKGERFALMVDRAQIDEALGTRPSARFVVTDGSPLVDLLAWAEADFYRGVFDEAGMNHLLQYLAGEKQIPFSKWWSFVRKAPEVWLVNTFELAQPPVPDVLVFVHVPVGRAVERLRQSGRPLEPHENQEFLGRLVESYRQVGRVLGRRRRVACFELAFGAESPAPLAEEIAAACQR